MHLPVKKYLFLIIFTITLLGITFFFNFRQKEYTVTEQLSFDIQKNNKIFLQGKIEQLEFIPSPTNELKIVYQKKVLCENSKRGKKILEKMKLDIYREEDIIAIKPIVDYDIHNAPSFFIPQIGFKIKVYLPHNLTLNIKVNTKKISICDLKWKEANITLNAGDIYLKNIEGNFFILTYQGNIIGYNVKGSGKIISKKGNINIKGLSGVISTETPEGKTEVESMKKKLIAQN